LISNNFGRHKNDPAKDRKALATYVELKGYKNGEIGRNHSQDFQNGKAEKMTLDEIAKQLGTSKTNLTRALRIERNLTDSMKELLELSQIIQISKIKTTNVCSKKHILVVFYMSISIITIKYKQIFRTNIRK